MRNVFEILHERREYLMDLVMLAQTAKEPNEVLIQRLNKWKHELEIIDWVLTLLHEKGLGNEKRT